MSAFVVSAECPTCGAPIDFEEDTHAFRCGFCSSNLLVTGRRHVLSYRVSPSVDAQTARSLVRFEDSSARVDFPELVFVPYYRLTACDFRWEIARPEPIEATAPIALALADPARPASYEVRDRYVEKNFIGIDGSPDGFPYSLGIRPAVVKLGLFRPEGLPEGSRVLPPSLPVADALERAELAAGRSRLVHRELVDRVLSLVYFPFWVVPVERRGESRAVVVDAVARTIVERQAPRRDFAGVSMPPSETVGFRPLACPNCGWDLPVRPRDVVFPCDSCERAWELRGARLDEVRSRRVTVPVEGPIRHLPFWIVADGERRLVIPGFRCRRLKLLADLGRRLSARPIELGERESAPKGATGVAFDREDALALARFVTALEPNGAPRERRVEELVWIPFAEEAYSLRDPFLGTGIPKNLV